MSVYKNRYSILFKAIAIVLVCLFVVNDIAWAAPAGYNPSKNATLAPQTELPDPELREKFKAMEAVLMHPAENYYLATQIPKEKDIWKKDWEKVRTKELDVDSPDVAGYIENTTELRKIKLIKVTGLFRKTGQFAHVGLSGKGEGFDYGMPVMYVDSEYCEKAGSAILKHERDEMLQWEELRSIIAMAYGIDKASVNMRTWIKTHIKEADEKLDNTKHKGLNSVQIAKQFHNKSYPLRELYKLVDFGDEKKFLMHLDYAYIQELYNRFIDEKGKDINIAAHVEDTEPRESAGVSSVDVSQKTQPPVAPAQVSSPANILPKSKFVPNRYWTFVLIAAIQIFLGTSVNTTQIPISQGPEIATTTIAVLKTSSIKVGHPKSKADKLLLENPYVISDLDKKLLSGVTSTGMKTLFDDYYLTARQRIMNERSNAGTVWEYYHIAGLLKAISRYSEDVHLHQFDTEIAADLQKFAGLPIEPPYKQWAQEQGGQLKTIKVKAYFYSDEFLNPFVDQMVKQGFKKTAQNTYTGVVGKGLKVQIDISIRSDDDSKEIKALARDETVNIIYYFGHSGVGANLYKTFSNLPKENYPPKVFIIDGCKSLSYYSCLLSTAWPQAQIVDLLEPSNGYVDTLGFILEGIEKKENWQEIGRRFKETRGFPNDHFYMPNDPMQLQFRDIDGNGVADILDSPVKAFSSQIQNQNGQKLVWAVNYLSAIFDYYSDYKQLTEKYNYKLVSTGWFVPEQGQAQNRAVVIEKSGDGIFAVKMNAEYANKSQGTIVLTLIHELSKYFPNDHTLLTLDDNEKELSLAMEYMEHFSGQDLFDWYKKYAGFPQSLTYEQALKVSRPLRLWSVNETRTFTHKDAVNLRAVTPAMISWAVFWLGAFKLIQRKNRSLFEKNHKLSASEKTFLKMIIGAFALSSLPLLYVSFTKDCSYLGVRTLIGLAIALGLLFWRARPVCAAREAKLRSAPLSERPPPGSIYSIFKYLCDNKVTTIDGAISGKTLAKSAGEEHEVRQNALSFESIEDDLRGLLLHLHLIEKAPGSEMGKDARYYVPEAVKKKSTEIFPLLEQFRDKNLRLKIALLEQIYEEKIGPIIIAEKYGVQEAEKHEIRTLVEEIYSLIREKNANQRDRINVVFACPSGVVNSAFIQAFFQDTIEALGIEKMFYTYQCSNSDLWEYKDKCHYIVSHNYRYITLVNLTANNEREKRMPYDSLWSVSAFRLIREILINEKTIAAVRVAPPATKPTLPVNGVGAARRNDPAFSEGSSDDNIAAQDDVEIPKAINYSQFKKSTKVKGKIKSMDELCKSYNYEYELMCYGLTQKDSKGNTVLTDIVLPRKDKILIMPSYRGGPFISYFYLQLNQAMLFSKSLAVGLDSEKDKIRFYSDNPELSFSIAIPQDYNEFKMFHDALAQLTHKDFPLSPQGFKETMSFSKVDIDWDIIIMNKTCQATPRYVERVKHQETKNTKADYHLHYHPICRADVDAKRILQYSNPDLSFWTNSNIKWGEIRQAVKKEGKDKPEFQYKLYNIQSEIEAIRYRLFSELPYFNNATMRTFFERTRNGITMWRVILNSFLLEGTSDKRILREAEAIKRESAEKVVQMSPRQITKRFNAIFSKGGKEPLNISPDMPIEELGRLMDKVSDIIEWGFAHRLYTYYDTHYGNHGRVKERPGICKDYRDFLVILRHIDIEANKQQAFKPLDSAMKDIRDLVKKSITDKPEMPALIIIDGAAQAGKSELARAINPNSSSSFYLGRYKNLGLGKILPTQNVVVVHGDLLEKLFAKKAKNPTIITSSKIPLIDMPYKVLLNDTEWFNKASKTGKLVYQFYLKHYIDRLLSEMSKLYGVKNRIVIFDESGSHHYFAHALNSKATERAVVIKAKIRHNKVLMRRDMSYQVFMWHGVAPEVRNTVDAAAKRRVPKNTENEKGLPPPTTANPAAKQQVNPKGKAELETPLELFKSEIQKRLQDKIRPYIAKAIETISQLKPEDTLSQKTKERLGLIRELFKNADKVVNEAIKKYKKDFPGEYLHDLRQDANRKIILENVGNIFHKLDIPLWNGSENVKKAIESNKLSAKDLKAMQDNVARIQTVFFDGIESMRKIWVEGRVVIDKNKGQAFARIFIPYIYDEKDYPYEMNSFSSEPRSRKARTVNVSIPSPLIEFVGGKKMVEVRGATVEEALDTLTRKHSKLRKHLFDKAGELMADVRVFLNNNNATTEIAKARLAEDDKISIILAPEDVGGKVGKFISKSPAPAAPPAAEDKNHTSPCGSIYGVFEYLCNNNITSPSNALTGAQLGTKNRLDRAHNTLRYDLRGLYYHLHLIEKASGTSRESRYYVPEQVKKKMDEILPILEQFRGENLRPDKPLLDQIYKEKIKPILEAQVAESTAAVDAVGEIQGARMMATKQRPEALGQNPGEARNRSERRAKNKIAEPKFFDGMIYDPDFIRAQISASSQTRTLYIDLDETIAQYIHYANSGLPVGQYALRPDIEAEIQILKKQGYRIVLWTDAIRKQVEGFFKTYPSFAAYFDLVITRENVQLSQTKFDYPLFDSSDLMGKAYQTALALRGDKTAIAWKDIAPFINSGNRIKDINLIAAPGQGLLIDNDSINNTWLVYDDSPQSPLGRFAFYLVSPFFINYGATPVKSLRLQRFSAKGLAAKIMVLFPHSEMQITETGDGPQGTTPRQPAAVVAPETVAQPIAPSAAGAAEQLTAQNKPDIENALKVMNELIPTKLEEGRVYEIRYDKERLRDYQIKSGISEEASPEALLKTYVQCLQMRVKDGNPSDVIKLVENGKKGLISVTCYLDKTKEHTIGESSVNIKGDLQGQALKIIGMLNMALAAANIPTSASQNELNEYDNLIKLIQEQYEALTGNTLPLENILQAIRSIELPTIERIPLETLGAYYELTIKQLRQAA